MLLSPRTVGARLFLLVSSFWIKENRSRLYTSSSIEDEIIWSPCTLYEWCDLIGFLPRHISIIYIYNLKKVFKHTPLNTFKISCSFQLNRFELKFLSIAFLKNNKQLSFTILSIWSRFPASTSAKVFLLFPSSLASRSLDSRSFRVF